MLSRHWDNAPIKGIDAPQMSFFGPGQLVMDASVASGTRVGHINSTFEEGIIRAAQANKDWEATRTAVTTRDPNVAPQFQVENELLFYDNRLVIPNNIKLQMANFKRES